MTATISQPEARIQVISALEQLSLPSLQERVWIDALNFGSVDYVVDILDDYGMFLPLEERIGSILRDKDEAESLRNVSTLLDRLINELDDADSLEYIRHADWSELVNHSKNALLLLVGNDLTASNFKSELSTSFELRALTPITQITFLLDLQRHVMGYAFSRYDRSGNWLQVENARSYYHVATSISELAVAVAGLDIEDVQPLLEYQLYFGSSEPIRDSLIDSYLRTINRYKLPISMERSKRTRLKIYD